MKTNADSPPIRLMIVDDHPVVRIGLSSMLGVLQRLVVAGVAASGKEALSLLNKISVDIVLLDLRMPELSGIETLKAIQKCALPPKIIVLSSFEFDEEIYQAVEAGAQGYLLKDMPGEKICTAIQNVYAGKTFFPSRIADRLAERDQRAKLSPRELEILKLVAKGLTNKEIGRALNNSQYTVRNNNNHITVKLDARDRTEAAFIALQAGILMVSR
jgi:DNA-binding NarL/FixJ family response regulator